MVWKKIENHNIFSEIRPGSLISQKPSDPSRTFKVSLKTEAYLNASRADGPLKLIILSLKELISGKWWLKEELNTYK